MARRDKPQSFLGTPATAPGPLGPQMLRAFSVIRRNPLEYLISAWREFGDVVQFPIPRPPTYLINDPDGVRRVLVGNGRNYGKSTIQYRSLSLVTGEGLLVADTPAWRHQRPLVQPAFHHETLEHIVGHVDIAIQRMFSRWDAMRPEAVVDMDAAMMHGALEVVGRALFGTDLSADADRLATATLSALDVVVARARVPITPPAWVPTPANRKLQSAVRELDGAVGRMMEERRQHPAEVPADMLDMLMGSRDGSGAGLTVTEIRNQVVTFIVAGHETVASALTWSWALLAQNPQVQRDLQAESDTVLGGRPATFADYGRLPFARAVFDEALRLYPPAWLITRKAHEADVLGGHEVPAGSLIILSPWLLHRHPALWPDPDEFRPSRFLGGEADRSALIPFGAGLRQCIGRDFAYVEGVLMLSSIAGSFAVEYPAGGQLPRAEPLVTVRPVGGLPLRVTRR
ncbi:MAG: cytochrome P450 [Actinobacteria bacterium]|nr:cytochrome P450 [Actinomycetota bacterium]